MAADPNLPTPRPARAMNAFSLDVRSLAVARIFLGAILILDLFLYRLPFLTLFYTDAGVFPKAMLADIGSYQAHNVPFRFGLLTLVPDGFALHAFFGLTLVCYLAFTAGYRPRLFAALAFVCLWSMHQRNAFITSGPERVQACLLFCCIFLPVGERLAVSRGSMGGQTRVSTPASALLVTQIALIYFFGAYSKQGSTWLDGTAVSYALRETLWIHAGTSAWAAQFPLLCKVLTYVTLAFEYGLPLLILAPWRTETARLVAALSIASFHLGLAIFLDLGLFPLVGCTVATALLPSRVWQRRGWLQARHATEPPAPRSRLASWGGQGIVCIVFAIVLLQNSCFLAVPAGFSPHFEFQSYLYSTTLFKQQWAMYAPDPTVNVGWVKVAAPRADARSYVDLRTRSRLNEGEADLSSYKSYPLKNFVYGICGGGPLARQLARNWSEYELRKWNEEHPLQASRSAVAVLFSKMLEPPFAPPVIDGHVLAEIELPAE